MQDPFVGEIMTFAGNFAPRDFWYCDGSMQNINTYAAVYSILGVMYGGDGRSTFGLPDLRGRVIVGFGQGQGLSPRAQGNNGGAENVAITVNNMPAHTHTLTPQTFSASGNIPKANIAITANSVVHCDAVGANSGDSAGNYPGTSGSAVWSSSAGSTMNAQMVTTTAAVSSDVAVSLSVNTPTMNTQPSGSSLPMSTMQPWLCVSYCIALVGIYPSRP